MKLFHKVGREMSSKHWAGLAFPGVFSVQCFSKRVPQNPKSSEATAVGGQKEAIGPTLSTLASANVAPLLSLT